MAFNCLKTTEPLQGGSLLFAAKFLEITGTHFIDLRRTKGSVDLGATQWLDNNHFGYKKDHANILAHK